ncbi:GNAT family N-acetyltransferase [Cupriavidus sp. CuC1]|uniref:GNAT family N-acetyltransferase n=1 Tax=Cupriavidus sp. CuC1 TaxID=3373131 RepID=UPI0037CCF741
MPLTIRPETPADVAAIERLTAAAFRNAPHTSHTEHFIVNALRRAGQLSVSLVGWDGAGMVGHVALSALRGLGAAGCVVLGDPAFYGRFGFVAKPELVLAGVPAEYFQSLSFQGSRAAGAVRYHAAFDATA